MAENNNRNENGVAGRDTTNTAGFDTDEAVRTVGGGGAAGAAVGSLLGPLGFDTGEAAGTVGGGAAGAAVGSLLGPLGTVVGGLAGAALGKKVGEGFGDANNDTKNVRGDGNGATNRTE